MASGLLFGKKLTIQQCPNISSNTVKPQFKNVPLSNFDHQNWCNYLNIKIKAIFSRNEHMPNNHSPCLIGLDELHNNGTHWISCAPSNSDKKNALVF